MRERDMRDLFFFYPFFSFSPSIEAPSKHAQSERNKRIREQEKQKRMREDLASPTEKERRREK